MNFNLPSKTQWLVLTGSHAYGTATATSDIDVRGWCVPPKRYRSGFLLGFEQADSPTQIEPFREPIADFLWTHSLEHKAEDLRAGEALDGAVYDVRKFVKLAADANPNVLDILFSPPETWIVAGEHGKRLYDNRKLFLSRKCLHTFSGYAHAQIARIQRHRRWLLNPPTKQPERKDFDLPPDQPMSKDQMGAVWAKVKARIDSWEIDFGDVSEATKIHVQAKLEKTLTDWYIAGDDGKFKAAGSLLGFDTNFLAVMEKERQYKRAMEEWDHFKKWERDRNAGRADLERKHHYDTKHGGHLVRLLQACREILTTGDYSVRRPNREELLGIRNGAWSYERLMEWATQEESELHAVARSSPLPHGPDRVAIDTILCQIVDACDLDEDWKEGVL